MVPARPAAPLVLAAAAPAATLLGGSAMSVEDYAEVVRARARFVDFLLAPARGRLADAA